ncbi:MAG: hypothetical protein U1G05_12825 [Kiritimatiellia bacterium]
MVGAIERGPPAPPQAPPTSRSNASSASSPTKDHERYQALRERVLALNQLNPGAQQHARPDRRQLLLAADGVAGQALWVFLRLLHQKNTLDSFHDGTDRNALANRDQADRGHPQGRHRRGTGTRIVQSLTDKLATMKERLANHKQAEENRELLRVEIDKTEQKTVQICAKWASPPVTGGVLSQQVDGIAGSVAASEQALAGLNLSDLFDAERAPNLLQTGPAARMEKE